MAPPQLADHGTELGIVNGKRVERARLRPHLMLIQTVNRPAASRREVGGSRRTVRQAFGIDESPFLLAPAGPREKRGYGTHTIPQAPEQILCLSREVRNVTALRE